MNFSYTYDDNNTPHKIFTINPVQVIVTTSPGEDIETVKKTVEQEK